ncbi:MAG: SRPBCC family protein [Solirubrobacteraceae bacterium]
MPTASASRSIDAPAERLWEVVSDPHHLPRWWPRVERVEAVEGRAFTEVLRSDRGRLVRADFVVLERDERKLRVLFAQQVAGTPFARILVSSETEVVLRAPGGREQAPTEVSVTLEQTLPSPLSQRTAGIPLSQSRFGLFAQLGSPLVRRAAHATVKGALDGLQRIAG